MFVGDLVGPGVCGQPASHRVSRAGAQVQQGTRGDALEMSPPSLRATICQEPALWALDCDPEDRAWCQPGSCPRRLALTLRVLVHHIWRREGEGVEDKTLAPSVPGEDPVGGWDGRPRQYSRGGGFGALTRLRLCPPPGLITTCGSALGGGVLNPRSGGHERSVSPPGM